MTIIVVPDDVLPSAVVEQVWFSMLHQPPLPWTADWPAGRAGVQADITVEGDWTAALQLWCSRPAAVSITRALLMLKDVADPESEDVEDALGEVLNVVAGSLKGALGGASALGLPRVGEGAAPALPTDAVHLALSWHDEPVLISILPFTDQPRDPSETHTRVARTETETL